jgi:hypothetical protein
VVWLLERQAVSRVWCACVGCVWCVCVVCVWCVPWAVLSHDSHGMGLARCRAPTHTHMPRTRCTHLLALLKSRRGHVISLVATRSGQDIVYIMGSRMSGQPSCCGAQRMRATRARARARARVCVCVCVGVCLCVCVCVGAGVCVCGT